MCTTPISTVQTANLIVSDPLDKVIVAGAPRSCIVSSVPMSAFNMYKTLGALRALELAGVAPNAYLPPGIACAGQQVPDTVAQLQRGYAFRIQGDGEAFGANTSSGTVATSTDKTQLQLTGGPNAYGAVQIAQNATTNVFSAPSPPTAAFTNVNLGAGVGAVTPQQLAAVTPGPVTTGTYMSATCGDLTHSSSFGIAPTYAPQQDIVNNVATVYTSSTNPGAAFLSAAANIQPRAYANSLSHVSQGAMPTAPSTFAGFM